MIEDFNDKNQPESDIRIHFNEELLNSAKIKVIGVGGGGASSPSRRQRFTTHGHRQPV